MAASTPSTIILKGDPIYKEKDAGGAITPGHLIQRSSDGDVDVHATAGGNAAPLFAVENDIAGDDITHAYAAGEVCKFAACYPGCEVYAWAKDGEVIVIGSYLESAGNGSLKVVDVDGDSAGLDRSNSIVAIALEAKSPSGADARIKVEIV